MNAEDNFDVGLMNLLDEKFDEDEYGNKVQDGESEGLSQFTSNYKTSLYIPPDHNPLGVWPNAGRERRQETANDPRTGRSARGSCISVITAAKDHLAPPSLRKFSNAAGFLLEPGYAHMAVMTRRENGKMEAEPGSLCSFYTPDGPSGKSDSWLFRTLVEYSLFKWRVDQAAICTYTGQYSPDMHSALILLRSLAIESVTVTVRQVLPKDIIENPVADHLRLPAFAAAHLLKLRSRV